MLTDYLGAPIFKWSSVRTETFQSLVTGKGFDLIFRQWVDRSRTRYYWSEKRLPIVASTRCSRINLTYRWRKYFARWLEKESFLWKWNCGNDYQNTKTVDFSSYNTSALLYLWAVRMMTMMKMLEKERNTVVAQYLDAGLAIFTCAFSESLRWLIRGWNMIDEDLIVCWRSVKNSPRTLIVAVAAAMKINATTNPMTVKQFLRVTSNRSPFLELYEWAPGLKLIAIRTMQQTLLVVSWNNSCFDRTTHSTQWSSLDWPREERDSLCIQTVEYGHGFRLESHAFVWSAVCLPSKPEESIGEDARRGVYSFYLNQDPVIPWQVKSISGLLNMFYTNVRMTQTWLTENGTRLSS